MSFADALNVAPQHSSIRIFLAKRECSDTIWHLCDAALGSYTTAAGIEYIALHGKRMHVEVKADTVLQADLQRGLNDALCERCLDEFYLAIGFIKEKRLLKFE